MESRFDIAIATDLRVPVDTVGKWRRRFLTEDRGLPGHGGNCADPAVAGK
jgi:hypothetical protein